MPPWHFEPWPFLPRFTATSSAQRSVLPKLFTRKQIWGASRDKDATLSPKENGRLSEDTAQALKKPRRVAKSGDGSQRGCRRGLEGGAPWGGQPQAAPAFPCLEDSPLEKVILTSRSTPREAGHDIRLLHPSASPHSRRKRGLRATPAPWQGKPLRPPLPPRGATLTLRQGGALR